MAIEQVEDAEEITQEPSDFEIYDFAMITARKQGLYDQMKAELDKILTGYRYRAIIARPYLQPRTLNIRLEDIPGSPHYVEYCCFSNWQGPQSLISIGYEKMGREGQEIYLGPLSVELEAIGQRVPKQEMGIAAFFGGELNLHDSKSDEIPLEAITALDDFIWDNRPPSEIRNIWKAMCNFWLNKSKYMLVGLPTMFKPTLIREVPEIVLAFYNRDLAKGKLIEMPLTPLLKKFNFRQPSIFYIDFPDVQQVNKPKVFYFFNEKPTQEVIENLGEFSKKYVEKYYNEDLPKVVVVYFESGGE